MTSTKTEEVEFEKTYKLETTIVPTNRVRARQDWADQVYKTETANGVPLPTKPPTSIRKAGRFSGHTTSVEKSDYEPLLAEQEIPNSNAKPENVERESEIVARLVVLSRPLPPAWLARVPTSSSEAIATTCPPKAARGAAWSSGEAGGRSQAPGAVAAQCHSGRFADAAVPTLPRGGRVFLPSPTTPTELSASGRGWSRLG